MRGEKCKARMQTKRDAILAQAIETFAEDGFQNADVHLIAEKAGIGYCTVYRYFHTKEELFWAATHVVLEQLGAHLRESISQCHEAIEALRAVGLASAGFFEAHPKFLAVIVETRAEFHGHIPALHREFHEEMVQMVLEILERGIAKHEIRPIDTRSVVMSLDSVVYGTLMFGCYVEDQYTLSELARQTLDVFLAGITPGSLREKPVSRNKGLVESHRAKGTMRPLKEH